MSRTFRLNDTAVAGKDVHFQNFYLNTANGTLYESDIVLQLNSNFTAGAATLAGFEAAYVGQVAKGDVQLRDLDKFWDANGRFMIEIPEHHLHQERNGKQAVVTLANSTDTLRDIEFKLNNAVAFGLVGLSTSTAIPTASWTSSKTRLTTPRNPSTVLS